MSHSPPQIATLSKNVDPRQDKDIYAQEGWWRNKQNEKWIVTLQEQEHERGRLERVQIVLYWNKLF